MSINRNKFMKALDSVKPGLSSYSKASHSNLMSFCNGFITTYNDEISITAPLPELKELNAVVSGEALMKILPKLKDEEIEIFIEGNEINFECGRSKIKLNKNTDQFLSTDEIEKITGNYIPIPQKEFCKGLLMASNCAGKNKSQPLLMCVNVTQNCEIISSDNYRLLYYQVGNGIKINEFLIPSKSANQIAKLKVNQINVGNGWVHFKNEEELIISSRIMENDKFPNFENALNFEGTEFQFPKIGQELIDRASIFSKESDSMDEEVIITIANRKFKIQSLNNSGSYEEDINFKYDGTPVNFAITPSLFKGILSEDFHNCIISGNKLKFIGENWTYVALLRQ